jgi:hypothetical protein
VKIRAKFHNQPCLDIQVDDTETGQVYYELTRRQAQLQQPFYSDTALYTPEYMITLAHQAREAFGWDWFSDTYDTSVTALLHKDLEHSIGQLGFEHIPEQYDQLLYDLHHCLHAIQHGKTQPGRSDHFQIEWLTDQSCPLPASFEFSETSSFGDLILINPYVGHNPLQVFRENDWTSITTTCRFHDRVKPGIVITQGFNCTKDAIVDEFKQHVPEFVAVHGEETIRYYSGIARIGRVTDTTALAAVLQSPGLLQLDQVEFYD